MSLTKQNVTESGFVVSILVPWHAILSPDPASHTFTVTVCPGPPSNASKTCLEIHDGQTLQSGEEVVLVGGRRGKLFSPGN